MIVVMHPQATPEQIKNVEERLTELGFKTHPIYGQEKTVIGAIGDKKSLSSEALVTFPGVEKVVPILKPYKLVSKELKQTKTTVRVGTVEIGSDEIVVMAGPCAVESVEQLISSAHRVKEAGAKILRGGAFKPREYIDTIFDLALKNNLPIDFHVDESDEPEVTTLDYIAEKTIATGMEGKVTAGHCTSLAAVSDKIAEKVIAQCAEAGLHIVTLPSCNLYLMGRKDKQPIRRGVTRVKDFLKAGVNIAYASDNIRDPFRPYGNADMLEEGLLTAQVLQMGTPSELETVFRMGTYNPAKILGLKNYGTQVGCKADLVLLEAASPSEALISQATKAYVFKNGKPVAKTIKQQILL
jgi:cytosine/adenosine deaminase-related metal-dependent hydrolase